MQKVIYGKARIKARWDRIMIATVTVALWGIITALLWNRLG